MEKPRTKVCEHYSIRKLKDFESQVLRRDDIFCDSCFDELPKSPVANGEGLEIDNLLMCLSCFDIGCNRQTSKQCMLGHGEKTKHHVTYSLSFGAVWCYLCDYELKEFLLSAERGKDEKYDAKLEKLDEYIKSVDGCFQKWFRRHQDNARRKAMEEEENKISEENTIKEEGQDTEAPLIDFDTQVAKDSKSYIV